MPADQKKRKPRIPASGVKVDENIDAQALHWKRENGLAICAECRRLKIKCDKKIPCLSCKRRGCAYLCPHGSLKTGEGIRHVVIATEPFHRRIDSLNRRILQLEDVLRELHSKSSCEEHPLLQIPSSQDEKGDQNRGVSQRKKNKRRSDRNISELSNAVGTLSISNHGVSRYYGGLTGGPESLISAQDSNNFCKEDPRPDLTKFSIDSVLGGRTLFSRFSPLNPHLSPNVPKLIASYLPSYNDACDICSAYKEEIAPVSSIVSTVELDEIFLAIYSNSGDAAPPLQLPNMHMDRDRYFGPHDLALIFIIFALGSLVKFYPSMDLAEHFYHLSHQAILLQPVLVHPSISTIQTLVLTSTYIGMVESDFRNDLEHAGSLRLLAIHLSQSIGLHRDSSHWGFSLKIMERRLAIFWHMFSSHLWECFRMGRPPLLSRSFIDCSFPTVSDGSKQHLAFWSFTADILHNVIEQTFTPEMPSYETIMQLDRNVRNYSTDSEGDGTCDFKVNLMWKSLKSTTLMYIHLSFFARTLMESPENPLRSPYGHSFLATYRSSSIVLETFRSRLRMFPVTASRLWALWTLAFSAAVVFGTIVAKGPCSPFASLAQKEFEKAYVTFEEASKYNARASMAFAALVRLKKKVQLALDTAKGTGMQWASIGEEDTQDELSVLTGHARIFRPKPSHQQPTSAMFEEPVRFTESKLQLSQLEPSRPVFQPYYIQDIHSSEKRQHIDAFQPQPSMSIERIDLRRPTLLENPVNDCPVEKKLPSPQEMYSERSFDANCVANPNSTEIDTGTGFMTTRDLRPMCNTSYQQEYFPSAEPDLPIHPLLSSKNMLQQDSAAASGHSQVDFQETFIRQEAASQQDCGWRYGETQSSFSVDYPYQQQEQNASWLTDIGFAAGRSALGREWEIFMLKNSELSSESDFRAPYRN